MYAYIKGTLEETAADHIVVDNHGIGYNIQVSGRILDQLPALGEPVKLYTYTNVREDSFTLFGFLNREDVNLFRMLITVSGIGPKGGLAILSVFSADELRFAVLSGDDKTIARAPGIGKKTAQRLIIELKDKIHPEDVLPDTDAEAPADAAAADSRSRQRSEASMALVALGYSASDAARILSQISITEDSDTETILKEALKRLSTL
ncbi:MAG: Holliday junction branch migration protein RuvA [Eubacterium sp.]